MRRAALIALALALVAAACGDDDTATTTTEAPPTTTTTTAAPATTDAGPALAPAEITFEDQQSDGTTIIVASITLPAPGFIAVHSNVDGGPGPVIGNSDLLPAGTSTDVVVTLDQPLESTDMVFPMAHIDVDGDGAYLFAPPDNAVDLPAQTASGEVAVVGGTVTIG